MDAWDRTDAGLTAICRQVALSDVIIVAQPDCAFFTFPKIESVKKACHDGFKARVFSVGNAKRAQ